VRPGGVVVFDDYGFWGCEGVTQAVHEIRAGLEHALLVHNLNGHAVLVRTG
jgi:O-methyltransferase